MDGTLVFGIPPDRANRSRAFVKFAPERSVPVRTDDSRLAPLRSEKGPIMYPPLALFVMNRYGAGSVAGTLVFGIPPDRTYLKDVASDGNIAPRMLEPEKLQNDKSAPVKFAPTRFCAGPIMYPPDTEVITYL
jgi:hypothetical protein